MILRNIAFLLTFVVFLAFNASAQQLKTITKKTDDNSYIKYEVLKSDKKVKHGKYSYFESNQLKKEGQYTDNMKSGTWTEYGFGDRLETQGNYTNDVKTGTWKMFHQNESNQLRAEGEYAEGKRIGDWMIYNAQGLHVQTYDFTNNKLTQVSGEGCEDLNKVIGGKYDGLYLLDVNPKFKAGEAKLMQFIYTTLEYPPMAVDQEIQGTVMCSFVIDKNGDLFDLKIVDSPHDLLSKECIRVVKLTIGKWDAAKLSDEKVKIAMKFPIRFRLE